MKRFALFFNLAVGLSMLLAACSGPTPTPPPVIIPSPSPTRTVQPSPTPAPVEISITFKGDQCTYNGPQSIPAGKITLDWTVKNKDKDKYGLVVATLDKGKVFQDIDQWPSSDPPPWLSIVSLGETSPGSHSQLTVNITNGPIYFICFYSPPDTKFDTLGPVFVENAAPTLTPLATITPHAAPLVSARPRPVIIDTDMGADDWMAILYLLQRTDLSIQAITVSGTGLVHCAPGMQHALGLVALAGHMPVPVACGRETPLHGRHTFPDGYRSAADTLMGTGISLPEGKNPSAEGTAVKLLASIIQSSPEKVTVLTLGPSTNLAELLETAPAAAKSIERIYMMGGAVHVPGNLGVEITGNQVAEWNIYIDPHAANIVLKSGIPVTLVPLDATNQVPITNEFYRLLQASRLTPEAQWIYDLFTREQGYFQSSSNFFWDPLTAAILTEASLATYEIGPMCVVEEEGPQSGQIKLQAGCPDVQVAIFVNAVPFEQIFLDTLNNP